VGGFEREGAVDRQALGEVVEAAVREIHVVATNEAVEAVAKDAAAAVRHEAAMVTLESVAHMDFKLPLREFRHITQGGGGAQAG
jgi:hypothetical protein